MSQLRADIWCAAFIRRHNDLGEVCVIVRRGDPVAGQIWIEHDHLDGTVTLYAPAPAPFYAEGSADRLFERRLSKVEPSAIKDRIDREARFDADFWLISIETRLHDIGIKTVGKKDD